MINIKEAYCIALTETQKQYEGSELQSCIDIGDRYVFSVSFEGCSIKGASLIAVNRENGEIAYLSLPNDENFEMLRKGKQVDISEWTIQ